MPNEILQLVALILAISENHWRYQSVAAEILFTKYGASLLTDILDNLADLSAEADKKRYLSLLNEDFWSLDEVISRRAEQKAHQLAKHFYKALLLINSMKESESREDKIKKQKKLILRMRDVSSISLRGTILIYTAIFNREEPNIPREYPDKDERIGLKRTKSFQKALKQMRADAAKVFLTDLARRRINIFRRPLPTNFEEWVRFQSTKSPLFCEHRANFWVSGIFSFRKTATSKQIFLLETLDITPSPDFVCPITQMVMAEPVTISSGHTYERTAIQMRYLFGEKCLRTDESILVDPRCLPVNKDIARRISLWKNRLKKHGLTKETIRRFFFNGKPIEQRPSTYMRTYSPQLSARGAGEIEMHEISLPGYE